MRKVIFKDRSYVFIKDEQEPAVLKNIAAKKTFKLNHAYGYEIVAWNEIARITSAGNEYVDPNIKKIEAPKAPELTDEQRAKNLERLAEMKKEFLARKAKRENAQ